jgi:hypothetical protein
MKFVPENLLVTNLIENSKINSKELFASRPALGPTHSLLSSGYRGVLSSVVKLPRREADHSPPTSSKVKNAWCYTSTPQYVFMAWCLVKNRDNFTFIFTITKHYKVG